MTDELFPLLHQRYNAYRYCLCNRNVENERHYKQLRNQFICQVRLAKRQFFAQGAKSGGKSFWTNIKSVTGIGRQKRKYLPWPAATKAVAYCSANMINNFFINSANEITANYPTEYCSDSQTSSAISSSSLPAAPDNFSVIY